MYVSCFLLSFSPNFCKSCVVFQLWNDEDPPFPPPLLPLRMAVPEFSGHNILRSGVLVPTLLAQQVHLGGWHITPSAMHTPGGLGLSLPREE